MKETIKQYTTADRFLTRTLAYLVIIIAVLTGILLFSAGLTTLLILPVSVGYALNYGFEAMLVEAWMGEDPRSISNLWYVLNGVWVLVLIAMGVAYLNPSRTNQ